jgi:hypothetical protein
MTNPEYAEYVRMLAENGLKAGESPRTVARSSVIYPIVVGDEQTVSFHTPYVDDQATQTRLWPKDIISGTDRDWSDTRADTLRELAVEILVADLYDAYKAIEHAGWQHRHPDQDVSL